MASIFLSHSSLDNEVAGDLSRRLKEHGYDSLFLDFDPESGIKAGHNWERALYGNLKRAGAVVVLCSEHSMAPTSRWCFVEIAQAKALGKWVFPIVISPCRVENILKDCQVIDLTAVGEEEAYRRLFDGLRAVGLDPWDSFHWDPKRPPFPGLHYFDAEDAGIYFGREVEVRQVIETLTRLQRQGEPRLLVVVGSSGSGKSSLVRAGVLPRLSKDRAHWALTAPFRPGSEPIAELARALFSVFPEGKDRPDNWKAIRDRLRDDARAASRGEGPATPATSVLTEYADDLTMLLGRREASMLVVVDQVEELLQGVGGDEASDFFTVLRRATERPGGRVFGLLTLRSDFLGSFQNHPALRGVAFVNLPLGPLPLENFPQVIEGPADRAAIALEPGLVPSMIADARTDDALPLLAFTLREMYERCRDQERLTLKVYREDLGGINGAVARVVERIKAERTWTPEVARALRRAFLKLVRVNDEGQFIRQPCRWADLPELAAPVLESFVKARLLSSDGDVVEVAHESLFRVWPELAAWLDEGRELMLWKRIIQDEVEAWIAHDRSPLYLLSGARVAEGRRWLASNAEDFPGPEGEFITASIAAEDDRIARERAQQEKLRWLARILAVAAVTASLIGIYAINQRNEANTKARAALEAEAKEKSQRVIAEKATDRAETQARIATSRRLASLSVAERDKRFDRSLLLAVEAFRAENTSEARESLYRPLQERPGLTSFLHVHVNWDGVSSVAFSPDGKTIAAGAAGGVVLWDVTSRRHLADGPLAVNEGLVWSVAFSPDGKTIAAGFSDSPRGGVVLWDVATRKRLPDEPLAVKEGKVTSMAFSPDGTTLAAGFEGDGGVLLWDVASRKRLADVPLAVTEGRVTSVAVSTDGKILAAGYVGGVVLWDLASRKRLAAVPLAVKEGRVSSVAFRPDGRTIAAGFTVEDLAGGIRNNGGVVLWEVPARRRLVDELAVTNGYVQSVAFSPDGKTIAAGYRNGDGDGGDVPRFPGTGGLVLWDVATRKRRTDELLAVEDQVWSVAFSPDGKTIAAGYGGNGGFPPGIIESGVALWEVSALKRLRNRLEVNKEDVRGVAFSPDGRTVAAGYRNREGGGAERPVEPFARPLPAAGYRKGDGDGGVVLWNVATRGRSAGEMVEEALPVKEGQVWAVAFSPDGKTIAAAFVPVTDLSTLHPSGILLWDVAARTRLTDKPIPVNEGYVQSVTFSPDGKTIAAGYTGLSPVTVGGVVVWDVASLKRLADMPLAMIEGGVAGVAFSPDGKTIAAGFGPIKSPRTQTTGGLVLWDLARRKRLSDRPFYLEQIGGVAGVAFSPDGKSIAAGYGDRDAAAGGVVLWDLDLESWVRRAGQIVNRNFTLGEWGEYFPDTPYRATFPDLPVPPEVTPNSTASPTVPNR